MEEDHPPPNVGGAYKCINSLAENGPSILRLPDEILILILQFLPFKTTLQIVSRISKRFYEITKDPKLVPKSFVVPVFHSDCSEKNRRHRKQILYIVANASLLQTLSIELNNSCPLDDELQLIGGGGCKKLTTLGLLGINERPSTGMNSQNNMATISDKSAYMLKTNCPCLSPVVLHNYICGDGGQAAANFVSHILNLRRLKKPTNLN